jgi:hypothetical protein
MKSTHLERNILAGSIKEVTIDAMMRKLYLMSVCIFAAITAMAMIGLALVHRPTPGVTKENFDRIKKGTSMAQVEFLFGKPFDDSKCCSCVWTGKGNSACIFFDTCPARDESDDDAKVERMFWRGDAEPETVMQKVRGWFSLVFLSDSANNK